MAKTIETAENSQPENSKIPIPDEEQKRFAGHGIARVIVQVNSQLGIPSSVEIDISTLSDPKHAWFGKYTPQGPTVVISSEKQKLPTRHIPRGIVTFDPNLEAVGLVLSMFYNVSPHREILYNVDPLQPVYRAGK